MGSRSSSATPAIAAAITAGIDHEVHSYAHDPDAPSYGAEAAAALGVDPAMVFKTLLVEVLVETDAVPVCALVPVTATVSLKAVAQAHGGKRAAMMEPAKAERLTGYVVGGISPLGQRSPRPTVIDVSALALDRIYVSAGRRGLEISLAPADLIALTQAVPAAIATPGRSSPDRPGG